MGMQISNTSVVSTTQASYRRTADTKSYGQDNAANTAVMGSSRKVEQLKLGFGEGTVSTGVAAMRAIDTNMYEARQLVPTVEELQEQARERAQEVQAQFEDDTPATETYTYDFQGMRTKAGDQARNYINSLNDAAATVQARLNGESLPSAQTLNIRIGDNSFNLGVEPGVPRFDVRA